MGNVKSRDPTDKEIPNDAYFKYWNGNSSSFLKIDFVYDTFKSYQAQYLIYTKCRLQNDLELKYDSRRSCLSQFVTWDVILIDSTVDTIVFLSLNEMEEFRLQNVICTSGFGTPLHSSLAYSRSSTYDYARRENQMMESYPWICKIIKNILDKDHASNRKKEINTQIDKYTKPINNLILDYEM